MDVTCVWVTSDACDVLSGAFSLSASHGRRFCSSRRYLGWLMAYTYGSRHATNLQAQAGIIVTPGVSRALSPNAPISDITPYGVHEHTYKKQIVMAAFAIRISADSAEVLAFERSESTFIFFAWWSFKFRKFNESLSKEAWCTHLLAKCFLVVEDVTNNLTIIVDDQSHRKSIAKGKNNSNEEACVKRIGEVIKRACRQVSLCNI